MGWNTNYFFQFSLSLVPSPSSSPGASHSPSPILSQLPSLDFPSFTPPFPLCLPSWCRCSKIHVMFDGQFGCPPLSSSDSAQGCSLCICLCKSLKHRVSEAQVACSCNTLTRVAAKSLGKVGLDILVLCHLLHERLISSFCPFLSLGGLGTVAISGP